MKQPEVEPFQRRHLIKLAETYAKAKDIKLATVSRQAHGDPPFFDKLKVEERAYKRNGKRTHNRSSFTVRVYDGLVTWFYDRWPSDTAFPPLDLNPYWKGPYDGTPSREPQQDDKRPETPEKATQDQGEGGTSGLLAKLRRNVEQ